VSHEARAYLLCVCDASDWFECCKNPPRGHPFSVFVTASVIYTLLNANCRPAGTRRSVMQDTEKHTNTHARVFCGSRKFCFRMQNATTVRACLNDKCVKKLFSFRELETNCQF
jgi:hypothetical protein